MKTLRHVLILALFLAVLLALSLSGTYAWQSGSQTALNEARSTGAAIPRPFDPDDPKMDKIDLDRGFIYGENRGDYALIEIPTLYQDGQLYDTDNYDTASPKDPDKDVARFVFAIYDAGSNTYTPLVEGVDVALSPVPYEHLTLYSGDPTLDGGGTAVDFVGSRFQLQPLPQSDGSYTSGGQALYDMLNNRGSLKTRADGDGVTHYYTTLAVLAEDAAGRRSDYTQVWLRPWFALGVKVISYAPTHPLTGELYRLQNSSGADPADFASYETDPALTDSEVVAEGSGKWLQVLRIKSSELLGGFDSDYDPDETTSNHLLNNVDPGENLTYALTLKKAANLTYTRVKLELNPSSYTGAEQLSDFYENDDPATRTFLIQDTIQLICGDVDQNGKTKIQDYDAVYDYVYRSKAWSEMQTEPVEPDYARPAGSDAPWDQYDAEMALWAISVYNPKSLAYRCDLDGDRNLAVQDLNIVNTKFNYNRDETDYHWYQQSGSVWTAVLPFGLGARDNAYTALFALNAAAAGEIFPDAYWDALVDPAETLAIPMETIYIDAEGNYILSTIAPRALPAPPTPKPAPTPDEEAHDERPEIPLGEEAQNQRPTVE